MATTSVRDIELMLPGSFGKETLSNDGMQNLALGISGAVLIPLAGTDVTLTEGTTGQAQHFVQILTGTLTANVNVIVPAESRVYIADNRTTGAFTVTVKTGSGGGIAVDQGVRTLIYCDGTNVYPVAGASGGGGSGAPTDATYLVQAPHSLLTGERVVTDTATVTWDFATPGQARAQIPDDAVTYAKLQPLAAKTLLGRYAPTSGDAQEILLGSGLTLDGSGVLTATVSGAQPADATLTALAGVTTGANTIEYFTGVDVAASTPLTPFARTLLDDEDQTAMQSTLGVVPGTTVQPLDATLTALAGVTTGADRLAFFTGSDTATTTALTAFMRSLLDDPDAATARATLGVTSGGGATPGGTADQVQYNNGGAFGGSAGLTLDATQILTMAFADPATVFAALAPLTTKGDLLTYTTAPARLPVGTDGQVLTADSAEATGIKWAAAPGGSGSASVGATVQRVATQSITQNVNTAVAWDTQTRDDQNFWAPGDATKLTIPTTGWYAITAFMQWDSTTGVTRIVNVRVGGTQYIAVMSEGNAGADQRQSIAVNWYLTAGEYVEIVVFQSTAGARQITGNASIVGMTVAPDPATTFLALTDTPDAYSGQGGNLVTVNAGATGLDFTPFTPAGRALLDDADAAAQRTTLALGTMATQDASAVAITGGTATVATLTTTGAVVVGGNLGITTDLFVGTTSVLTGNTHIQGRLGVGSAPAGDAYSVLRYPRGTYYGLKIQPTDNDTGVGSAVLLANLAGTAVGSIHTSATATAYNTASDVRLKHAIAPLTGALDSLRAVRPVSHRWNADDSLGESFLAHELMVPFPLAVTGQPDEVNEDGSIKPQQVDHSKMIPRMVAWIQELLAKVETLEAQVAALQGA